MSPSIHSNQQGWTPVSASFVGMLLGWGAMVAVTISVAGVFALLENENLANIFWFACIFGVASLLVCLTAWLFVALPLTTLCWERISQRAWWNHGILGLLAGIAVGFLPIVISGDSFDPVGLWFVGLAGIVGAVAGTAIGWWAWKTRLLQELALERSAL